MKCQAEAMASVEFHDEEIPSCDNDAEEEVDGWQLCAPCAEALRTWVGISKRVVDENGETS